MKIGVRKFINMVAIGFKSVEIFKKIVGGASLGLVKKTLNMIDGLMRPILVRDSKRGVHASDEVFDPTCVICEEVTLWMMTCCAQQSFLSQLRAPTGSSLSFGQLAVPEIYPVMSQLINTRFILSFHLCQFSSVK
jgi:hypothetical protein